MLHRSQWTFHALQSLKCHVLYLVPDPCLLPTLGFGHICEFCVSDCIFLNCCDICNYDNHNKGNEMKGVVDRDVNFVLLMSHEIFVHIVC